MYRYYSMHGSTEKNMDSNLIMILSYKGLPVQLELIAGVGTGLLLLSIVIFIIILIIILTVKHKKRTIHVKDKIYRHFVIHVL